MLCSEAQSKLFSKPTLRNNALITLVTKNKFLGKNPSLFMTYEVVIHVSGSRTGLPVIAVAMKQVNSISKTKTKQEKKSFHHYLTKNRQIKLFCLLVLSNPRNAIFQNTVISLPAYLYLPPFSAVLRT